MNVEEINVLLDRVETVLRSQNKIEAEFLYKVFTTDYYSIFYR